MNIIQVYKQFPDHAKCIEHLEKVRWNGKPKCPYCDSMKSSTTKTHRYHCNSCNTSYSVTVDTIFHSTKLDLQKWFLAISMILNAKKGISARQLARDLEINKNTAWYMGMRIRQTMLDNNDLLSGIIEMDETYMGGKPRKSNKKSDNKKNKRGRGTKRPPVVGMVEREGKVKAYSVPKINSNVLKSLVRRNVSYKDSTLMTDEFHSYRVMDKFMKRLSINHKYEYVNGNIHTNTIEGFWALLKRSIVGQYHKVSLKYLQKYVNEVAYKYNNRKTDSDEFFNNTLMAAVGV